MPTLNGLGRRYAFALSLFLPVPGLLPAPPPGASSVVAAEQGVPDVGELVLLPGVVIEEIPKDSALEKAGLKVGDVILSWERLPNPPANPEGARGEIRSPFDWVWVEIEQAPRGVVMLGAMRDETNLRAELHAGSQGVRVRPRFGATGEALYRSVSGGPTLEKGESGWKELINLALGRGSKDAAEWLEATSARLSSGEDWHTYLGRLSSLASREATSRPHTRILEQIGDALLEHGQAVEALAVFEKNLAIVRSNFPGTLEYARALERVAAARMRARKTDSVLELLSEIETLRRQLAPGSVDLARSLNNKAALYLYLGENEIGLEFLSEAIDSLEVLAPESEMLAASVDNRGLILARKGHLALAEIDHRRALEIRSREPGTLKYASTVNNLALVLAEKGDFDAADDYLRQALTVKTSLQGGKSLDVAMTLNALGTVARDRGLYQEAEWFHRRALEIREKEAPNSLDCAASLINIAGALTDQGRGSEASSIRTRAFELLRERGVRSREFAALLNNMAVEKMESDSLAEAKLLLLEALEVTDASSLLSATVLRGLGIIAEKLGNLGDAEGYYRRSLEIRANKAPSTLEEAEALATLGWVLRKQGRNLEAATAYQSATETLRFASERLEISRDRRASMRARHLDIYREAIGFELQLGNIDRAVALIGTYKQRSDPSLMSFRDESLLDLLPQELRKRRDAALRSYEYFARESGPPSLTGETPGQLDARLANEAQVRLELSTISREIQTTFQGRVELPPYRHGGGWASDLDPDTVTLVYFLGRGETWVLVVRAGEAVRSVKLDAPRLWLQGRVAQVRALLQSPELPRILDPSREVRLSAALADLYERLVRPCEWAFDSAKRTLIVPDGVTHFLPWAALLAGATSIGGDRYLAEKRPLYVQASMFLSRSSRDSPVSERRNVATVPIVAIGSPAIGVPGSSAEEMRDPSLRGLIKRGLLVLDDLPAGREELDSVLNLFRGETIRLVGVDATEERVKASLSRGKIIHFATHAVLDDRFPLKSAIVLLLPDGSGTDRENGLLQVWEIFEKVRLNADLVVLSACETALGEDQGGEGLIGLTRAFQYAGARSVIASLWKVNDQATAELMIRFYKYLLGGMAKDEALRHAQMDLIRGPIEVTNLKGEKELRDFSHPYYWAGFQLYGDWQ